MYISTCTEIDNVQCNWGSEVHHALLLCQFLQNLFQSVSEKQKMFFSTYKCLLVLVQFQAFQESLQEGFLLKVRLEQSSVDALCKTDDVKPMLTHVRSFEVHF